MASVRSSGVTREHGLVAAISQWSQPEPMAPLVRVAAFSIITTLAPRLRAPIAAKQPEAPPPITRTSVSISSVRSYSTGYGHATGLVETVMAGAPGGGLAAGASCGLRQRDKIFSNILKAERWPQWLRLQRLISSGLSPCTRANVS